MKVKKVPLRMCTGCGEMFDKRTLVRVVKSPEGDISLDLTGKKPGRGAYICPKMECFNAARKSKGLERSFKSPIDKSVYELLEQQLKELPEAEG
jgi:predicted RNA-binding protein YlxR (DUF448 family)